MSTMSLFLSSNASKFITHIPSLKKDRLRVNWLSIIKTKLRDCVQVVQDRNDELIIGNDVFQLDELVDPYRVALSNDLKENSIFCVAENTLVDVDVDELNDVLRTSRHT
jgi:hypothetical protein